MPSPLETGHDLEAAETRTTVGVDPPIVLSPCTPVTLKFVDVTYKIKVPSSAGAGSGGLRRLLGCSASAAVKEASEEKTILSGITGMVSPGELLAVLGPSGSGKSTLLHVLAGRLQGKYTGALLANGIRWSRPMLRRTGFVAQDDVLYPHLTVKETLVFCSLLRLPPTLSRREKVSVAEGVIAELGLSKCEDTIIGNGFVRGISGGERRRVSIGHEMLVDPSLLVLDEPTSGLDSTAAHRVVAALVGLARNKGKAVVASVHQPSSRVFQMFDRVLLLAEGRCVYFGRGREAMDYFAAAGFRPMFPVNPADFMLDLANGIAQVEGRGDIEMSSMKQDLVSSYIKHLAPNAKALITSKSTAEKLQNGSQRCTEEMQKNYCTRISWFSQFSILLHRSLIERRHEAFNALRVVQVVAAAILAGAMWWQSDIRDVQDRLGLLFFISIFWGVFPSFNAVFTFPQERAIFIKERSSGMYTLSSYFMARMAGDLPMELILPTIFVTITYWMAGLKPDVGAFVLTVALLLGYVLVAQGLGLLLGAVIMDAKKASTLATITMLAFLLTGGFYVQKVPYCLEWVKYTSCTFYCFNLLVRLQYSGEDDALFLNSTHHKNKRSDGASGGGMEWQVGTVGSVVALFAMFVGYRLLAFAALRRTKA